MSVLMILIVIVVAVIASALFSGLETAFTAANTLRIEQAAREGSRSARVARALRARPERFLTTTLFGTNVSNVTAMSLATYLWLQVSPEWGNTWALLTVTPVILIFAEILPKSLFRTQATRYTQTFAVLLQVCEWIFYPVLIFVQWYSRIITWLTGAGQGQKPSRGLLKQRLRLLLKEGARTAVIEDHESDMIHEILEFSGRQLGEVMIPIHKAITIRKTASRDEVLKIASDTRFTRFPVEDNGKFVGFINIFDLFYHRRKWQRSIRRLAIRDIQTSLGRLVDQMRMGRQAMIAVSSGDTVVGLATLEDIVEMIMGDIDNELGRE